MESRSAHFLPEHTFHSFNRRVLSSGQLLVPREGLYVLKALVPDRFCYCDIDRSDKGLSLLDVEIPLLQHLPLSRHEVALGASPDLRRNDLKPLLAQASLHSIRMLNLIKKQR